MPIKYAARGISTQFRTPSELVNEDGVTLKPVDGGEVFVYSNGLEADEGIYIGSEYNTETGGFKIEELSDEWSDTETANEYGYYVISDVVPAWYVGSSDPTSQPVKSNIGVADVWEDS